MPLPGCVRQGEAAALEVDAAVHQQLPEEQRGVAGGSTRGVLGGDLGRSGGGRCHRPGHELNDGEPGGPGDNLQLGLLLLGAAVRAQLAHGGGGGSAQGGVRRSGRSNLVRFKSPATASDPAPVFARFCSKPTRSGPSQLPEVC